MAKYRSMIIVFMLGEGDKSYLFLGYNVHSQILMHQKYHERILTKIIHKLKIWTLKFIPRNIYSIRRGRIESRSQDM